MEVQGMPMPLQQGRHITAWDDESLQCLEQDDAPPPYEDAMGSTSQFVHYDCEASSKTLSWGSVRRMLWRLIKTDSSKERKDRCGNKSSSDKEYLLEDDNCGW